MKDNKKIPSPFASCMNVSLRKRYGQMAILDSVQKAKEYLYIRNWLLNLRSLVSMYER